MKILLIEDSKLLGIAIARKLAKAGYEVEIVLDGQEGLIRAQQNHPDLILLDMMLPTLVGASVLRQIKQDRLTSSIPVVVLSGLSERNGDKLKKAGAAAYLQKSRIDLDGDGAELLLVLKGLLTKEDDSEPLASAAVSSGT
jgi:DNA-binding response OmpR family regulator